jgi:effector-binding domain-containing protein
MTYHVDRITLEPQPAAVVSGSVPHDGIAQFLAGAFGEVVEVLSAQGLTPAGPPFGRYVMTDDGWDIEAGFPSSGDVSEAGRVHGISLPGGPALVVLHLGPYEDVAAAYHAAEEWMAENDWTPTGIPWEAYIDEPDVAQPRTIVHLPARPA